MLRFYEPLPSPIYNILVLEQAPKWEIGRIVGNKAERKSVSEMRRAGTGEREWATSPLDRFARRLFLPCSPLFTLLPTSRSLAPGYQYRKIPIISSGLIFVQRAFLLGLFSGGAYQFRRGLLSEGTLRFKMGLACQ